MSHLMYQCFTFFWRNQIAMLTYWNEIMMTEPLYDSIIKVMSYEYSVFFLLFTYLLFISLLRKLPRKLKFFYGFAFFLVHFYVVISLYLLYLVWLCVIPTYLCLSRIHTRAHVHTHTLSLDLWECRTACPMISTFCLADFLQAPILFTEIQAETARHNSDRPATIARLQDVVVFG